MMRCETCCQEYTAVDFVALRNLCEHVYMDSLAQKRKSSLLEADKLSQSSAISQRGVLPWDVKSSEVLTELVSLEK